MSPQESHQEHGSSGVRPPNAAQTVRYEVAESVATVTLDRPAKRNALSTELINALTNAFRQAIDDPSVSVIVLTHTGTVFSAGADLSESVRETASVSDTDHNSTRLPVQLLPDLLELMWTAPKPVVVRVNGAVRGGGMGLVAAADLAIASTDSTFGFNEVRLGVIPASIAPIVLARAQPHALAEWFLTGDIFDAPTAAHGGLITRAVPVDALDETMERYIASLKAGGPLALAAIKRLLRHAGITSLTASPTAAEGPTGSPQPHTMGEALRAGAQESARYFMSPEAREGIAARMAHRNPSWMPPGLP